VLEVDIPRKRIALSKRLSDEFARPAKADLENPSRLGKQQASKSRQGARREKPQQPQPQGVMAEAFARLKKG
jgi:protein Tex